MPLPTPMSLPITPLSMPVSLPVVFYPEPGEILASYITRLSEANGFSNPAEFVACYMTHATAYGQLHNWQIIDDRLPFKSFYDSLSLNIPMYQLYDMLTLINVYGAAFHSFKQFRVYYEAFYKPEGYSMPSGTQKTDVIIRPRICPVCFKEKRIILKGHNLDGVTVCTEHRIPLLELKMRKKQYDHPNMLLEDNYKPISVIDMEQELQFAIYAEKFLLLAPDITKSMLYDFLENEYGYFNRWKADFMYAGFKETIRTIMQLCPSFEEFKTNIQKYAVCNYDASFYKNSGFTLQSPIKNNLVQVKCNKCGTSFITNSWAISKGFGCPHCEKDIPLFDRMEKIVDIYGDHEYKLLSLEGPRMKIQHTCGRVINKSICEYLGYKSTCLCELKQKQVKTLMERNPIRLDIPGITYLGHSKTIKDGHFRCDVCGREFIRHISTIRSTKSCPLCKAEERMRDSVDQMVGDRFTVIRYPTVDNKTVTLRCSCCGQQFTTEYRNTHLQKMENSKRSTQKPYMCPNCYTDQKMSSKDLLNEIRASFPPLSSITTDDILHIPSISQLAANQGNNYVLQKIYRLYHTGRLIKTDRGKYKIPEKPPAEAPDPNMQVLSIIKKYYPNQEFALFQIRSLPETKDLSIGKSDRYVNSVVQRLTAQGYLIRVWGGVYKINETNK